MGSLVLTGGGSGETNLSLISEVWDVRCNSDGQKVSYKTS